MLIFKKEGVITPKDDKTNITHCFNVPKGTEKLVIRYSYYPKTVDDALADELLCKAMEKYGASDAPKAEFLPVKNLVTLSFDEGGKYTGACHRQPNEQTIVISEKGSTPGIISRPVMPGQWDAVLNVHYVGCLVRYKLEVEAEGVEK